MERLPLNPDELLAEERAAGAALKEEEHAAHARHHKAFERSKHSVLSTDGRAPVVPLDQPEQYQSQAQADAEEAEGEFQAALARVPSWHSQLTARGLAVGMVLGALLCVVIHKMNLGPGIIPSLNIAAGLLAFMSLKGWTFLSLKLGLPTIAFGAQECNAVQTFVTACSSVAFTGGFGSYLTALDHQSYELLGGETTGNRLVDVYEPTLSRLIPYILSTSMIGVFMLVALRKTMIIDYNLTYPSGTATGLMIDSFFTTKGAKTAGAQLTQMARWFGVSFAWDAFKWIYSGTQCAFCSADIICGGMEAFPVFGLLGARWTWYLNLTPNIVGAGMICPHVVNLSMLFGALLTWGCLWPWIATKEGNWYPSGQSEHAFGGLFGYKVFITIALLMGDGLYNLLKVLGASVVAYIKLTKAGAPHSMHGYAVLGSAPGACGPCPATPDKDTITGAWYPTDGIQGDSPRANDMTQALLSGKRSSMDGGVRGVPEVPVKRGVRAGSGGLEIPCFRQGAAHSSDADGSGSEEHAAGRGGAAGGHGLNGIAAGGTAPSSDGGEGPLSESTLEHRLRTHVFLSDTIPSWISLAGFLGLGLMGAVVIPLCYPAARWYHVVVAFLVAPLLALPVSFGCGLTDWDVSSTVAKLGIFGFAAWAGLQSGGVVTGLAMAGVLMSATSTSACLMQDFRTGYIVKCAPRAMFVAQLVGALCGALIAPLTFGLFWSTGKVGDPSGPYPTPYASIFRAMAIFGTQGVGVLPRHCGALMLVFFLGALVVNLARDLLPQRIAKWLPIPMAMAIPFVLGAYIALDMAMGSLILAVWEWRSPESAELLAPAVASGLIVGDGVFSIPLSVMGMLGMNAPLCMAFGGQAASL